MECYNNQIKLNSKVLCLVNCLNFGHPNDSMGDFKQYLINLNKNCKKYSTPIVGGNVSLYNATNGLSIKPTPLLLMLGIRNKLL